MNNDFHIYRPYMICPFCGEQIECSPDFEFHLNYISRFGSLNIPTLRIQKHIPIKKILSDDTYKHLQKPLHDFIIKIAHKQPFFCTAVLTDSAYKTIDKMIEIGIVTTEEIYDSDIKK